MGAVARKAAEELGSRVSAIAKRFWREADAMHALLVKRADALVGCTEASSEELRALATCSTPTRLSAGRAERWQAGRDRTGAAHVTGAAAANERPDCHLRTAGPLVE